MSYSKHIRQDRAHKEKSQHLRHLFSASAVAIVFLVLVMYPFVLEAKPEMPTSTNVTNDLSSSKKYKFVNAWGFNCTNAPEFSETRGIAYDDQSKYLYVVDQDNNRVQRFDNEGHLNLEWGGLHDPYGIAVGPDGNVYVTEIEKNRVSKFDPEGNLISRWGKSGTGDGEFDQLRGIAVDRRNRVYIADTYNNRIQKFTKNGKFLMKFGTGPGRADDELAYPFGIVVDKFLNIFVADTSNHRILKFNSNGQLVLKWGEQGSNPGQFQNPRMLASDSRGKIYVTDAENDRIQKFSNSGKLIVKWGSFGSKNRKFNKPHGIAVQPNGHYVFVADTYNNRIQEFRKPNAATRTPVPLPTATSQAYTDDFSGYPLGLPPANWGQYGCFELHPTVEEIGGTGVAFHRLSIPSPMGNYKGKRVIREGLFYEDVVLTSKLNLQTNNDEAGIVVGFRNSDNHVDVTVNPFWKEMVIWEWKDGVMRAIGGTGRGGLTITPGQDYWIQSIVRKNENGTFTVAGLWSVDGVNFNQMVSVSNLENVRGSIGFTTNGFIPPSVNFDDISAIPMESEIPSPLPPP